MIEKILAELAVLQKTNYEAYETATWNNDKIAYINASNAFSNAMTIVQEVAKEYGKDTNVRSKDYEKGYDDGFEEGAESVRALAPYEDTDLDLLLNELIVPMEIGNICEELTLWDEDGTCGAWCENNCGVINDGQHPSAECYKAWLRMKKSASYQKGE